MEIVVEGTGKAFYTPNEVIINIDFSAKSKNYEEVVKEGVKNVDDFIKNILIPNGFSSDEMKTRMFVVREEKKYNEFNRSYDFDGYSYSQTAKIKFDYDLERLSKIMVSISRLAKPPICHINFGLKNEDECRKELLAKAYDDALGHAEAIAKASAKHLKECVKVDFKPLSDNYLSPVSIGNDLMYSSRIYGEETMAADLTNVFTPEDIELSETLYCLWIAE